MIRVLDHGFVRFIEDWGRGEAGEAEAGIIEAARQSTQGAFRGWELDSKLLSFLYTSNPKHATPFEFAGMVIEVKAPIFVFREWHRHRTQSYNEMSARYAPLPDRNYVPELGDLLARAIKAQGEKNRQASGVAEVSQSGVAGWHAKLEYIDQILEDFYQEGLLVGVPKEVARIRLPVGRYSQMRASGNLRNWLAFLTLRMDPGAQWEIRQFANAVGKVIAERFPNTWKLFEGERNGR